MSEQAAKHYPQCNPLYEGGEHHMRAERNGCTDRHSFVWTWPIEGGRGAVGVCGACRAVTTADRDAVQRREALAAVYMASERRESRAPWAHRFMAVDDSDECGICDMSADEENHHQPCCPGDGSMAHVRGCRNHPESEI